MDAYASRSFYVVVARASSPMRSVAVAGRKSRLSVARMLVAQVWACLLLPSEMKSSG